jgi:hypothetical protein
LERQAKPAAVPPLPIPTGLESTPIATPESTPSAPVPEGEPILCENCGRVVGKLETPSVWREKVVCFECHGRLSSQFRPDRPTPGSEGFSNTRVQSPPDRIRDPLEAFSDPDRNSKAGAVMLRVGFWIVAGLVILYLLSQIAWTDQFIRGPH